MDPAAQQSPFAAYSSKCSNKEKIRLPQAVSALGRKVRLAQELGFDHGPFLLELCQQKELLSLLPVSSPSPCLVVGMSVLCLCIADPDFALPS